MAWCSPKPSLMATGDRSIGPSCLGSPANTNCPNNLPFSFSLVKRPATGINASGSIAWPLSSINKWEKWPAGIFPVTSLMTDKHSKFRLCCPFSKNKPFKNVLSFKYNKSHSFLKRNWNYKQSCACSNRKYCRWINL